MIICCPIHGGKKNIENQTFEVCQLPPKKAYEDHILVFGHFLNVQMETENQSVLKKQIEGHDFLVFSLTCPPSMLYKYYPHLLYSQNQLTLSHFCKSSCIDISSSTIPPTKPSLGTPKRYAYYTSTQKCHRGILLFDEHSFCTESIVLKTAILTYCFSLNIHNSSIIQI